MKTTRTGSKRRFESVVIEKSVDFRLSAEALVRSPRDGGPVIEFPPFDLHFVKRFYLDQDLHAGDVTLYADGNTYFDISVVGGGGWNAVASTSDGNDTAMLALHFLDANGNVLDSCFDSRDLENADERYPWHYDWSYNASHYFAIVAVRPYLWG